MIFMTDQRRATVLALITLDDDVGVKWVVPDSITLRPMCRPAGLAMSRGGQLVVADSDNHRILLIDPDTGTAVALEAGASAIGALCRPAGVAVSAAYGVLVADSGNHRIAFSGPDADGGWSCFGRPGVSAPGQFHTPVAVHVDHAGRILVTDPGAGRLVRIDAPDGTGWTELALPPGLRPARPYALAAGPGGGILVGDLANGRVLLIDTGDVVSILVDGTEDGGNGRLLVAPVGLAMLGDTILVADAAAACLSQWSPDPGGGQWHRLRRVDGRRRPQGGPEFSSLAGLAVREMA